MAQAHKTDELHLLALQLVNVIKRYLWDRGKIKLEKGPTMRRMEIVEFKNQMRVFDIEKFETQAFVSTVNYYDTYEDMKENRALGFLVICLEKDYLPELLKLLQYPEIDWDDEASLKDASGALCNVLAGQFKTAISRLCKKELEMSHFSYYEKNPAHGVEFSQKQKEKYEITVEWGGKKRIALEMSMGPLPLMF